MTKKNATAVVTIRLTEDMVERIDNIKAIVQDEREFILKARITRSDLVRYLLLYGLEAIEQKTPEAMISELSELSETLD